MSNFAVNFKVSPYIHHIYCIWLRTKIYIIFLSFLFLVYQRSFRKSRYEGLIGLEWVRVWNVFQSKQIVVFFLFYQLVINLDPCLCISIHISMFCKEKKKKNIQQIYNVVNTLKFTQQIYMNSCNISVSRVQKKYVVFLSTTNQMCITAVMKFPVTNVFHWQTVLEEFYL